MSEFGRWETRSEKSEGRGGLETMRKKEEERKRKQHRGERKKMVCSIFTELSWN